tara:strand:+ start:2739 stop:3461 length:723 start_codon:yes stop_codon:yes gene_type:complete
MSIYYKVLRWFFLTLLLVVFCYFSNIKATSYSFNNNFIIQYNSAHDFQKLIQDSIENIILNFVQDVDSLKDINTHLLEELILHNKYINKAEVYLNVEGTLKTNIEFRQPFIKLLKNNKVYYFDSAGVMLPNLLKVDENLLVLSGDFDEDVLIATYNLISQIYSKPLLNKLIGGVYYDNNKGYILSAKACDLSVYIGIQPVLDEARINMIELFYNVLSVKLACGDCQAINITYDEQIICIN